MKSRIRSLLLLALVLAGLVVAFVVAEFLFLVLHTPNQQFEHVIGFAPPDKAKLVSSKTIGNHFDGEVEWLYELPNEIGAQWKPPSGFHRCENWGTASKYAEILYDFEHARPDLKLRFGSPDIWVGGRDGNAYIVISADGRLVRFSFFWT